MNDKWRIIVLSLSFINLDIDIFAVFSHLHDFMDRIVINDRCVGYSYSEEVESKVYFDTAFFQIRYIGNYLSPTRVGVKRKSYIISSLYQEKKKAVTFNVTV